MRLSKRWLVLFLVAAGLLFAGCDMQKQISSVEALKPFYGTFKGSGGPAVGKGEVAERDLTVTIRPWEDRGFTVDWTTVIHRDNRDKTTNMSINFYQSPRPGIFASAMRTDAFGKTVPFNPVAEDEHPYVWAGLDKNNETLTVSALYITEGGGHEMQIYKRSLHEKGLSLEFERIKDGKRTMQVSSVLETVADK